MIKGIFASLIAFAVSSRSRRVGGSGGRLACSSVGGNFLCVSIDDVLVTDDAWPKDTPEIVELNDTVEELDPRLTICVEPLRGGRAGDGCVVFRVGNGGGAFRAGNGGVLPPLELEGRGLSLSTGGGGRRLPLTACTPMGWLFACFVTEEP